MKKLLLPLLCLLPMAMPANAETKTYQLCTSEAEILNPDNQFIILAGKVASNKSVFALTNSAVASKKLTTVSIKSNEESVPSKIDVDAETKKLGFFSLKDAGNGNYFLYENTNGFYVGASSADLTGSTTLPTTDAYKLLVSVDGQTGQVTMAPKPTSTRAFFFQELSGLYTLKNYALSNKEKSEYAMPLFYKEVENDEPVVKNPDYEDYLPSYSMNLNDVLDFPSISPTELNYSFSSSDESIVKVDYENRQFIAQKAGEAVITFSTDALEGKYNAGEGSFTITVNKLKPILAFRDQIVYGKLGVGVVWEPVQVISPADIEERGVITYSSSDESIVTINPETGQILPAVRNEETGEIIDEGDIHAKGEVVITATMSESENYAAASKSYMIIIEDPSEEIEGHASDTTIFDFTVENPYGMKTMSGNVGTVYEMTEGSGNGVNEIKNDGNNIVTILFPTEEGVANNYRAWSTSSGYHLRMYSPSKFVVSVKDGYKISKIGITGTVGKDVGLTYTPASDTNGDTAYNSSWITKDDEQVSQVVVEYPQSGKGNLYIHSIDVMYENKYSTLSPADLSFENVVYSIYEDETWILNGVRNPHGCEVTYSIPNLSEDEYTINEDEDGNLEVQIATPGYYSLEARSEANETYRDGLAIMRVNVFYHLPVHVNGVRHEEFPIGQIDAEDEDLFVEIVEVPELLNIYYQLDTRIPESPANKVMFRAEAADEEDENLQEGFTKYEDGIDIPKGSKGTLHFYAANYGYSSPIRSLGVSQEATPVGVEEVVAPAEGNVRYYDLSGRMVSGKLLPGVYVRKSGSRTEKVLVK